jgi:hypothetical protein
MEAEVARHRNTMEIIESLRDDDLVNHAEYLAAKAEAEKAHANQVKAIEKGIADARAQQGMATLQATGQLFGNLADIAAEGGKNQFTEWKRMAQAQAGVSAALAITNALTAGPIMGPILATSIGGVAAIQIAKIEGMEYQGGRELGGAVTAGTYMVGERGPELVTMGGSGIVTPSHRLGGDNDANVTVVMNTQTGVAGTVQAELMQAMPLIERQILGAVEQAISRGGSMSRAVGRR